MKRPNFLALSPKQRAQFETIAALPLARRIRYGIQFGFAMGCVFSILVLILALFEWSLTITSRGGLEFSGPALIASYTIGGALAGLIYGACFPLLRTSLGTVMIGLTAAFFPIAGVTYSQPSTWRGLGTEDVAFIAFATVFWGVVGGFAVRAISIARPHELQR